MISMSLSPFIIPADQEKVLWSRDEYLDLMDQPEYDGRKFELLGGVIFEKCRKSNAADSPYEPSSAR